MTKPRALNSPKVQAAQKWLMTWSPFAPGGLFLVLGMVVLVYPEAFRIAVGFFFLAVGILVLQLTRVVRRMFRGLQAHVEVYSEEAPEESSSMSVPSESLRQWIN